VEGFTIDDRRAAAAEGVVDASAGVAVNLVTCRAGALGSKRGRLINLTSPIQSDSYRIDQDRLRNTVLVRAVPTSPMKYAFVAW
jgi:hypothetical protein